jgi:endoglucanase
MLVGGPNPGQEDGCTYPSDLPGKSYLDDWCSYASNEIAINWNASMAYLVGAIEAIKSPTGQPTSSAADPGRWIPEPDLTDISLFPNPVSEKLGVRFRIGRSAQTTVRVVDVLGREVTRPLDRSLLAAGQHTVAVDMRQLAPGMYTVLFENDLQRASGTVVLVR